MDQLLRIILFAFLFLTSVAALIAQSPRAGQRKAWLTLTISLFAGAIGGAALGALVGMLSPIQHGSIAGAVEFGVAGFFSGMVVALRLIASSRGTEAKPPSTVTVAGIAIGSGVGALVGLWLPLLVADAEAPFMFSFVGALLGVLAGALLGLTYENPLVGGGLTGLFLLTIGLGVTIGWLNDADVERLERSAASDSSAAPQPTIWDQMYDREKLLADLTADESGTPLQRVPILWLLVDGGPQFHRRSKPDSPALREVFAQHESFAGVWVAEIHQPDEPILLQYDFARDSDECTLTVSQLNGVILVDHGTIKVNGAEVTFTNDGGTLTTNFDGYQPR